MRGELPRRVAGSSVFHRYGGKGPRRRDFGFGFADFSVFPVSSQGSEYEPEYEFDRREKYQKSDRDDYKVYNYNEFGTIAKVFRVVRCNCIFTSFIFFHFYRLPFCPRVLLLAQYLFYGLVYGLIFGTQDFLPGRRRRLAFPRFCHRGIVSFYIIRRSPIRRVAFVREEVCKIGTSTTIVWRERIEIIFVVVFFYCMYSCSKNMHESTESFLEIVTELDLFGVRNAVVEQLRCWVEGPFSFCSPFFIPFLPAGQLITHGMGFLKGLPRLERCPEALGAFEVEEFCPTILLEDVTAAGRSHEEEEY